MTDRQASPEKYDAVIVGAGFAGLYALYRFRKLGLSAIVLEQAPAIGGTWYWNRYPGARCDVESLQYSYSFSDELQQEWNWSERYASQGEILRYVEHVADKFDLKRDIDLDTRVVSAAFDEQETRWTVETDGGRRLSGRYLIIATGCLSTPLEPDIAGLAEFEGQVYRTSQWPHTPIDFTGRRVAVVGTGSSGIQVIPVVAEEAEHLYVMQRTPNYSVPGYNGPMDPDYQKDWKAHYKEHRRAALETRSINLVQAGTTPGSEASYDERECALEARWRTGGIGFSYIYPDVTLDPEVNRHVSDFVRRKIVEKVHDPEVAKRLSPTEYGIGGRRLCVDNGYYETFNRSNVTLVDLREEPLVTIASHGFRTSKAEYPVDDLVLATGFDAITGALDRIDVRGRNGLSLKEKWSNGPANYLGLMVSGFPNMFVVTGPGSPGVLANVLMCIELHINWIAECVDFLESNGRTLVEASPEEEEEWVSHINEIGEKTMILKTKSWYTGDNVSGKTRGVYLYMGGAPNYIRELNEAGIESEYKGLKIA